MIEKTIRSLPRIMTIDEIEINTDKYAGLKGILDERAERYIKPQGPLVLRNPFGNTVWLTNADKYEANGLVSEMRRWFKDSFFYIGDPRGNDIYSVERLKDMGLVGIYEVQQASKIADIWPLLKNTLKDSEPESGEAV